MSFPQPSDIGAVKYCLLEAGLTFPVASGNYPMSWWQSQEIFEFQTTD